MRNNYGCDLDSLTTGSRIGMMRSASGNLHYYINGVDQGMACSGLPPGSGRFGEEGGRGSELYLDSTWCVSLRGVRCGRPVRSVCSGVHHQHLGPPGQQPVYQQRHGEEFSNPVARWAVVRDVALEAPLFMVVKNLFLFVCLFVCSCGRRPSAPQQTRQKRGAAGRRLPGRQGWGLLSRHRLQRQGAEDGRAV